MDEAGYSKRDFLRRLGTQVMRVRKQKGFSQDRLTLESRLSRGTVSRIERGLVDPRASTLAEIAVTLGVTLPELMNVSLEDTSAL